IYAMSACCMSPRTTTADAAQKLAAIPYDKAQGENFGNKASLASIAAWSPDPSKPPYYMDFGLKADGTIDPLIVDKWANNSPLVMATSHIPQLKSFRAVASSSTASRSEEHTSELQSHSDLVCRLLLEKKKKIYALLGSRDEAYTTAVM